MKDKQFKTILAEAYSIEPSESGKNFIRKYKRRELKISQLMLMQFKYMRFQYVLILIALIGMVSALFFIDKPYAVRGISSLTPFLVIILLTGLGKSERNGMDELEMTTRFSMRMIRSVRLTLAGTAGVISVAVVALTIIFTSGVPVPGAVLMSAFPYMITACACMFLIRRWHAGENIFGCLAIAAGVSVLSVTECAGYIVKALHFNELTCFILLLLTVFMMGRQAYLYVKESEELQWNLC